MTILLTKESKQVFDRETVHKTAIYLKGIGTRCVVCEKHIIKRQKNQETCSQKCRAKKHYIKNGKKEYGQGLHVYLPLAKVQGKEERILKVYLKQGVIEEIKLTPKHKELWALAEKIAKFRNKPLEIRN